MKKTLFAIFALCSLSFAQTTIFPKTTVFPKTTIFGRSAGTPTVVVSSPCAYNTGTTCNTTFSVAIAAGHRVAVWFVSTGAVNTPTMTGETFTAFTGASGCLNNTADVIQCWMITSAVGGQTSITCSTASATNGMCVAFDISAPVGNSPKDAGGNGTNAGATSFSVSTSAVTTDADDIVIACFGSDGAIAPTNPFSAVGPFTQVANFTEVSGAGVMMCETNAPGSTGTQTAQATLGTSARASYSLLAIRP